MALVRDAMEGAAADPVELAEALRRAADAERRVAALQQRIDELVAAASVPAASASSPAVLEGTDDSNAHAQYKRTDRALTDGRGLEAIGRAGAKIPYQESQHEPVGEFPNDGEPVTVIRPGYLWHAPGEAVLISKALVTRAKGAGR